MTPTKHAPLSEAELARDSHDSYYEAVRAIAVDVLAGRRELPEFFRSRRERES